MIAQCSFPLQLEQRGLYRRFSAGVIMAFIARFVLHHSEAERWLTVAFPTGTTNIKRNF